jgi:hypothetical protein
VRGIYTAPRAAVNRRVGSRILEKSIAAPVRRRYASPYRGGELPSNRACVLQKTHSGFYARAAFAHLLPRGFGPETTNDFMRNQRINAVALVAVFMLIAGVAIAADTANVAGTWIFKVTGDSGNADQTIVIKQDGTKITGTFKGPRQSGTIDGTVDGNNIKFHLTARAGIDYTGTVDGDTMKGTLAVRGKSGDWTATRAK